MTKAVLVIDMPKSCAYCDIRFTDEYTDWCPVNIEENQTDVFDYANNFTKPDWCPLKTLPDEWAKEYKDDYGQGFIAGWNAYRNRILGK